MLSSLNIQGTSLRCVKIPAVNRKICKYTELKKKKNKTNRYLPRTVNLSGVESLQPWELENWGTVFNILRCIFYLELYTKPNFELCARID